MTGVIWLFIAVRAIEHIVNRGVSVKIFLQLSALQIPNFIIHIIPFAIFIATLFVYSRLNSDRELIVLRAAGVSPASLAKPALTIAFFAVLIGYCMTLYVTPKSYQGFRNLQWDIRYSFAHVLLKEGVFNSISDNITIFIRERKGQSELRGILYHDTTKTDKPVTIIAERGVLTKSSDGARVTVFEGNRQEIQKNNNSLSILYFDRYTLDLSGFTPKPSSRYREARERMVDELLELKIQDVGNPMDFGKFKVEAHQRLTTPLNTFAFALVALVCLLLGDYSRRGQTNRIILASIIFFSLWVCNLGIVSFSAKNLQTIPFIYLSVLGPVLIMLTLLNTTARLKKRNT
jgi:lipopolysaccharide export system permease protein